MFGSQYNAERYQETLRCCALIRDLELFEYGDETEVGEKGVNLSGGQKARISLARAIYSKASILLLDDPLSAVDAPTAKFLLEEAICGPLVKGKTVILVTHHVSLCAPFAALGVNLEKGAVKKSDGRVVSPQYDQMSKLEQSPSLAISKSLRKSDSQLELSNASETRGKLVQEEQRLSGSVKLAIYWLYCKSAGGFFFLFLLFLINTGYQALGASDDWWLKIWADAYRHILVKPDIKYYVSIFAILAASTIIFATLRIVIISYGSIVASRKLHNSLMVKILRCPIRFFDTTPMGRILNRISKDIKDVDNEM